MSLISCLCDGWRGSLDIVFTITRREVLKAAFEYGATVYDAAFIALAIAHEVQLVTAERTTTRWVAKLCKRIAMVR
jgi:predicted nucleic acid-binding protein